MDRVQRIDRKLISKGAILDYYHDLMLLPDGRKMEYDLIDHQGAAAVLPVLPDGRLVMVKQYRNALERYTIEIPAGGLNGKDEPTIKAAARELSEETGYVSDNLELLISIYTTVAFCNEKIDIYLAQNLVPGKQHLDDDEYVEYEIFELDELVEKIMKCEIQDSKTVAAILAYKAKFNK